MDRLIYVAMTGAKHIMEQQATVSNNLANAATGGYRAAASAFRAVPVVGDGLNTRTYVVASTPGADFAPGVMQKTGRDLDLAIQGQGWMALQLADGSEAYTRDGSLQTSSNGILQTRNGLNVMGEGGPIAIPPDMNITIAKEGTVSLVPNIPPPNAVTTVGRIKLVNPDPQQLVRGEDGLFRMRGGGVAPSDPGVTIASGVIEGSNVNVVEQLIGMISLARQYDLQMKLLSSADSSANQASQILNIRA